MKPEIEELATQQVSERLGNISERLGALRLKTKLNVKIAKMAMDLHMDKPKEFFDGYQKALHEIAGELDELN